MKKWLFFMLCFGIVFTTSFAQKTEPIFEITAGNAVNNTNFLIQASTGELITANSTKLMGISPETKSVL